MCQRIPKETQKRSSTVLLVRMDLWTFPLLNVFFLPFLDKDCVCKINHINLSFKSTRSDNLMPDISTKNIAQIFDQISRMLCGKSCNLSTSHQIKKATTGQTTLQNISFQQHLLRRTHTARFRPDIS